MYRCSFIYDVTVEPRIPEPMPGPNSRLKPALNVTYPQHSESQLAGSLDVNFKVISTLVGFEI